MSSLGSLLLLFVLFPVVMVVVGCSFKYILLALTILTGDKTSLYLDGNLCATPEEERAMLKEYWDQLDRKDREKRNEEWAKQLREKLNEPQRPH